MVHYEEMPQEMKDHQNYYDMPKSQFQGSIKEKFSDNFWNYALIIGLVILLVVIVVLAWYYMKKKREGDGTNENFIF
jgi:ABC-type multidrug transport system permease subunit